MVFVAEKFLESVEANQNYAILLLNLVDKEDIDAMIRVAGSIAFKNFVKRNWNAHAVSVYAVILFCVVISQYDSIVYSFLSVTNSAHVFYFVIFCLYV